MAYPEESNQALVTRFFSGISCRVSKYLMNFSTGEIVFKGLALDTFVSPKK